MAKDTQTFIVVIIGLSLLVVQSVVGANTSTSAYSMSVQSPSSLSSAPPSSSLAQCDPSLWQHVYDPSRLQLIKNCVTVTGTITNIQAETDGDYHVLVKLDAQYANMTKLQITCTKVATLL